MVNKAKKRSLSESSIAEKAVAIQANDVNKKKKVENKVGIQNGQSKENVTPQKQNKADKKKQGKVEGKNVAASPQTQKGKGAANKKANQEKSAAEKNDEKLKVLKKRQAAKEKRKLKRTEIGNFLFKADMTAEQLKAKIEEIKKRDTLSKTAKRKLSVLNKKLRLLENGESSEQKPKSEKQTKNAAANKSTEVAKKSQKTNVKPVANKNKLEATKGKDVQNVGPNKKVKSDVKGKTADKKNKQTNLLLKNKQEAEDDEDDEEDVEEEEDVDDEEMSEDDEDLEEEEEEDSEDEEEDEEEEEDDDEDDEDDEDEDAEEIIPKKGQKADVKTKSNAKAQKQASGDEDGSKDQKQRYVLFASNLPYSATTEEVKKHFLTKVSEVTDVRIPLKPGTKTPRGFAYIEFPNSTEFEKGLSLHGSFLKDRRITVQYPASGKNGGNKKHIAKNHKLHALRKQGKLAGSQNKNQKFGGMKGKPNAAPRKT